MAAITSILAATAIASLAGSIYSAEKQRDAQKDAQNAQRQAELEARRIAAEKKPMEETATLKTDTGISSNTLGSLGLMIEPTEKRKTSSLGVSPASSGLGFGA